MGVTATAVASSVAATAAAVAASNATTSLAIKNEKIEKCKTIVQNFDNTNATVEQQLDFSNCVNLLYPVADSVTPIMVYITISSILLSMLFGIYNSPRNRISGALGGIGLGIGITMPIILIATILGII